MKRVILKLSGEVLAGQKNFGICEDFVSKLADVVGQLARSGIEVGIVIGAGNFWRGRSSESISKASADHMGMLATIINSIALYDALKNKGYEAELLSAVGVTSIAQPYSKDLADKFLKEGKVVLLAAGTGSPFFSTDSGAALRACELSVDAILLGKKVDGVYDSDPEKNKDAVKYDFLSYDEAISKKLGVMDLTAMVLCMENDIPIHVFGLRDLSNILSVCEGKSIGTILRRN